MAVSACAGEDAGRSIAPEVLASAPGDVLAADSTGLVCEWRPVEEREGEWEAVCYREESTGEAEGDDGCRCWYLVTYRCEKGGTTCHKLWEDFLG